MKTKKHYLLLLLTPTLFVHALLPMSDKKEEMFYFYSKNKTYEIELNKVRKSSPLFSIQIQSGMEDAHKFDFANYENGSLSEQAIESIIDFIQHNYSAEIIDIETKPYELSYKIIDDIIDSKKIIEICYFADALELNDLFELIQSVVFPKIIYKNSDPKVLEKDTLERLLPQRILNKCARTITLKDLFVHYSNKKIVPTISTDQKNTWNRYQPLQDDCTELMSWLLQSNNDERNKQITAFLRKTFFFTNQPIARKKRLSFITRLLNIIKNSDLTYENMERLQNAIASDPNAFTVLAQEFFSAWQQHDTCFIQEIKAILPLLKTYMDLSRQRNSYYLSDKIPFWFALEPCFCDEICCCLFTSLAQKHRNQALAKLQLQIQAILQNWPDYPTE